MLQMCRVIAGYLKICKSHSVSEYKWIIYDGIYTTFMGLELINFRTNDYLQIEESLIKYLRPGYNDDMQ